MKNINITVNEKELEMIDEALNDLDPGVNPSEIIQQTLKKAFMGLAEGSNAEEAQKEIGEALEKAKAEFEEKKKNAKTQCLLLRAKLAQAAERAREHDVTSEDQ